MMASAKGGGYWFATIEDPLSAYDGTGFLSSGKNSLGEIAFVFSPRNISANRRRAGYLFVDANGDIIDQNLETQTNNSGFNTISFDSSDNIYACGYRRDSIISSTQRPYLVKYNSAGVKQWERTLDDPEFFRSSHPGTARHATDSSGNSYVGYYAYHTEDFNSRFFLTKVNASGTFLWTREHDGSTGTTSQSGQSIRVGLNAAEDPFSFVQTSSTGNPVEVFVKTNSSGTHQFTRLFPGTVGGVNILSAATGFDFDTSGNIYTAGWYWDSSTSPSGFPPGYRFSFGRLAKFDSSGTVQWQVQLGNVTEFATSEFRTADVAVDQSDGSLYFVGASQYDSGSIKGIFAKYNNSGVLQFQKQISSATTSVQLSCVEINEDGDIVIGGSYGAEGFIAKLPPDGSGDGTYGDFTYEDSTLTDATTTFSYGTTAVNLASRTTAVTSRSDTSVDPALTTDVTSF